MDSTGMIIGWVGTIVVTILCVIVVLKCAWTLGLPYAMLRSNEQQGWSIFPLIEFIPLLSSMLIAWAINLDGWFSPTTIGIAGFVLIAVSYVHLYVVLFVVGYVRSRRQSRTPLE